MNYKGLGVNSRRTDGNMQKLKKQLDYLSKAGFEYLEISADVIDTIGCGSLINRKMELLVNLLKQYPFKLTAHIQNGVDLRDEKDYQFQLQSLKTGIDFAGKIGAEVLVCHYEQDSGIARIEDQLKNAYMEGLNYASKYSDLKIGVENIEIDRLLKVADFVNLIDDPNLIMVLDVGHAYLSENYFGEEFLHSIREVSDLTKHIHLSDNFGKYEEMRLTNFDLYRVSTYTNRLNSGKGDLNLPPGWGSMPLGEVLEALKGFSGIMIAEYYHDKYLEFNDDICKDLKKLLTAI